MCRKNTIVQCSTKEMAIKVDLEGQQRGEENVRLHLMAVSGEEASYIAPRGSDVRDPGCISKF